MSSSQKWKSTIRKQIEGLGALQHLPCNELLQVSRLTRY